MISKVFKYTSWKPRNAMKGHDNWEAQAPKNFNSMVEGLKKPTKPLHLKGGAWHQ